jgi:hypothetical protein
LYIHNSNSNNNNNNNNNNKSIEWGFVCKIENKLKGELRGEKYRKMRA